jgi:transposase
VSPFYVGIDLHKAVVQGCVLDGQGNRVEERRWSIPSRESAESLFEWLAPFAAKGRLAVEALGCNRWFVNACLARGWDVLVVNASKLGLRKEGKKTDRRDAFEIARRLYLGDLDRCARTYYPDDAQHGLRKLTRTTHAQVQKRTRTIVEIRSMLCAYKIEPARTVLWTRPSIAWLREQALPTADLTFALQVLVDDLEAVQQRVRRLKSRIEEAAMGNEEVRLWMDLLPSVGAQTALILRTELGDASRFKGARQVASYAGVAPRVNNSADKAHHGAMTKRGNAHLRWILGQWAVRLLARDPVARAWAAPRYRRVHKNKLRVALARRLLIGVWVMLTRGEVFSLERCLATDRAA